MALNREVGWADEALSLGLNPVCLCRGQHANCQAASWHWLQDLLHLHDAPHCVWGLPLQCPSLPLFPAAQLPAPGCRRTEDFKSPVELGGFFSLSREAWGMLWKDLICNHFQVKRTRALMVFELCWEKVPMFSLVLPVWRGYRIVTGLGGWGPPTDIKYFAMSVSWCFYLLQ